MELFAIIVNCFQPLTIITKCSILDVAAVLDPPLIGHSDNSIHHFSEKCPEPDVHSTVCAGAKRFHDGGPYHMETSPLIFSANQWTGYYIIRTSDVKELIML